MDKQSGAFETQEEALADVLTHMGSGDEILVHADDCELMFDRDCSCSPVVYHPLPAEIQ